jgi:hypothetical protein
VGTRTRGTRVSSSPSKIPYGGFSPVRLQTGILPRPSPTRSGSSLHPRPAYTRLKSRSRKRATSPSRACAQAALSSSDRTLPSRGPWLASGLSCPAGSTLTMTSSETLASSGPTYDFAVQSHRSREVPQFTRPIGSLRAAFRTPADQTIALGCFFIVRFGLPHLCRGSASTNPRVPVPAWPCNQAAKFTFWYGPEELLALHRPGRLPSSFHPPESPHEGVEYNYAGKSANSRGRTCTGKTGSLMGCEQRTRRCQELRQLSGQMRRTVPETVQGLARRLHTSGRRGCGRFSNVSARRHPPGVCHKCKNEPEKYFRINKSSKKRT